MFVWMWDFIDKQFHTPKNNPHDIVQIQTEGRPNVHWPENKQN